jgi:hypothetical protein
VPTVDRLTGKFNQQLAGKIAIFVEELELTKSRSMENALKSLITDPTITIEPKGKEVYTEMNYARIFGATNHNHIWNVADGERRLTVFNVAENRANDSEYFGKLVKAFNDPAIMSRLMHELLNYKVDHGLVRKPLVNGARALQALATKTPNKEVALRLLRTGEISFRVLDERREVVASYHVSRVDWEQGSGHIPSNLAKRVIQDEIDSGKYGESFFTARDKRVSVSELVRMLGAEPSPDGKLQYTTIPVIERGERSRDAGYIIPPLNQARVAFCKYHGLDYSDVFGNADENIVAFPKPKQAETPF